jgi:hypothetical protein
MLCDDVTISNRDFKSEFPSQGGVIDSLLGLVMGNCLAEVAASVPRHGGVKPPLQKAERRSGRTADQPQGQRYDPALLILLASRTAARAGEPFLTEAAVRLRRVRTRRSGKG